MPADQQYFLAAPSLHLPQFLLPEDLKTEMSPIWSMPWSAEGGAGKGGQHPLSFSGLCREAFFTVLFGSRLGGRISCKLALAS